MGITLKSFRVINVSQSFRVINVYPEVQFWREEKRERHSFQLLIF